MLTGLHKVIISFRPFRNRLLRLCRVIRTYSSELPKVLLCSKNLRNAVQSVFSLILGFSLILSMFNFGAFSVETFHSLSDPCHSVFVENPI